MANVTLKKGDKDFEFSVEHAQNILASPVNGKVGKQDKYELPKDSDWKMADGKLVKKKKK